MKLSVSIVDKADDRTPFLLRGDYLKNILLAKEIGYDAVEMHIRDPKSVDLHEIKDLCEKENMAVSSIGTGLARARDGLSFMSEDHEVRLKTIERMRDFIKAAQIFNAVVIVGLIRGVVMPGADYAECEARAADMLRRCLEYAEKGGVTLVLEAINRYESNFLVGVGETLSFIKRFQSAFLKVHIDSFHMNIEEPSMVKSIIRCKNHLGHVHFADSDRMYPGHGHIQFDKILDALDRIGYAGYIAIECLARPGPVQAAKMSLEFLRRFADE